MGPIPSPPGGPTLRIWRIPPVVLATTARANDLEGPAFFEATRISSGSTTPGWPSATTGSTAD